MSSINFALLTQGINRYVPIPLLFFGIIGNILNILVFTRRIFRQNICVQYFLAPTLFDSIVIIIGLLPRFLYGFGHDYSQTSIILCKIRFFITYFAGYTSAWFISLACLERYLSSSFDIHHRQFLTKKRVYLSMIFVILFGCIIFGEHFYCVDINQQILGAPQSCYQLQNNIVCQMADSLLQLFFEMIIPAAIMIVCGILILRNIHRKNRVIHHISRIHRSVQAINASRSYHTIRKRDAQLRTMLFVQVDKMKTKS